MAFDKKAYDNKYHKKNYFRVLVLFPEKDRDRIKDAAALRGMPVGAFVKKLVLFELDSQEAKK